MTGMDIAQNCFIVLLYLIVVGLLLSPPKNKRNGKL